MSIETETDDLDDFEDSNKANYPGDIYAELDGQHEEIVYCEACGTGVMEPLGVMGKLAYFECRDCANLASY